MENFIINKISPQTCDLVQKSASIADLAAEIWREHYTPIIGAAQVEYMLANFQSSGRIYSDIADNGYLYFTAEYPDGGEMAAYCACQPNDGYLLLSKLYVRRRFRGNGIARRFLNELKTLCGSEYSFGKIRLTVNKYNSGSIAAYHKLGFTTVDSVVTDIGGGYVMDDYIMELSLPPVAALI